MSMETPDKESDPVLLHKAAQLGQVETIRRLLQMCVFTSLEIDGALLLAIYNGCLGAVKELLTIGTSRAVEFAKVAKIRNRPQIEKTLVDYLNRRGAK